MCAKCSPCNITTEFSGGGSFSDGKLSINDNGEIGGDLATYIGLDKFRQIMRYTDDLYVRFRADSKVYSTDHSPSIEAIQRSAAQAHLKLIDSRVRHMGTEKAYDIYSHIQQELQEMGIDMLFDTPVTNFIIEAQSGGEKKNHQHQFCLTRLQKFYPTLQNPIEYGRYIAELGNMLSGNKALVQRFGDLKRGRRTTKDRLAKNTSVQPTLKDAVLSALSLVIPYRLMLDISETIEVLDKVMPGLACDGTLLYGVEVKFYSNRIVVDKTFQTNIHHLHVLGDGTELTRGLMQASMNGVCMGRILTGGW